MPDDVTPTDPQGTPASDPATTDAGTTASTTTDGGQGSLFYSGTVPKELEPQYKEMQSSYTRQMQKLSAQERTYRAQPAPTAAPQAQATDDAGEPDAYAGQVQQMETQVREIRLQLLDQQIDRFAEKNPDVYEHANDMADQMLKVPGLTLNQAYWMVKGPKAEQAGMASAMKTMQTKLTTSQAGPVGSTSRPAAPKTFNSIKEAAADAYNTAASSSRG